MTPMRVMASGALAALAAAGIAMAARSDRQAETVEVPDDARAATFALG